MALLGGPCRRAGPRAAAVGRGADGRVAVVHMLSFVSIASAVPGMAKTGRRSVRYDDAYPERSYYGGPEHICPYCHAVFWFQERVKNDSFSTQRKIVYNLCCKGGKVNLKPFECPPPLLADLLKFDGDAIGIVTSISAVAPHRSRGQHTTSSKRTISLCGVGNNSSVNVVLWGAQASLFPGEQIYNDGQSSPQILMFVGTLVKKYAVRAMLLTPYMQTFCVGNSTVVPGATPAITKELTSTPRKR
ncbi:hypothetical protein ZEAMMB73_Zm00001d008537 [Zea mays]|uniref:Uncharacterized protein n=1 Tax=Zea mays TaxID=4577 RepID=A0A1D6FDU4_MAIZE|nr:hypothetical protein ZEAMMB73_Zm00001d008537 [Zea mays]